MSVELWQQCVELLREELPAQQFNTWIRPLQVEAEGDELRVYAPNRFVLDWVNEKYLSRVLELLDEHGNGLAPVLSLLIGRSEEHTSELQSRLHLVCRLLLEQKKTKKTHKHLN